MKNRYKCWYAILLLLVFIAVSTLSATAAVHVDSQAAPGGDGSDWDHAFNTISQGIGYAGGDEIWVKAGIYGRESGTNVIYLTGPVKIYGGFSGTERTEADRDGRDWKNNPTILDPQGGQCISLNLAQNPYIDGFVLTGSNSVALNIYASSPTVVNCLFRDNATTLGAVSIISTQETPSRVNFLNCVFLNNTGPRASAVYHSTSYRYSFYNTYVNCTFAKNIASGQYSYGGATIAHSGGFYGDTVTDYFYNTIIWDNTYTTTYPIDGSNRRYSSYIEGMSDSVNPPVYYTNPPGFADLANNDVHLVSGSPCIDAGTTALTFPSGLLLPATDFEGDPRIVGLAPDIGADEFSIHDVDYDGVTDSEEMGPDGDDQNYDGNNDGLPDSRQDSVASLHTYNGISYVTLAVKSPEGGTLADVTAVENPSPGDTPAGVTFNYGFFNFTISGLEVGGAASIDLFLPVGVVPTTYYRHGPTLENTDAHWYEFVNDNIIPATGADINGNQITLWFIDGQRGDDILSADGMIVDAGGPGFMEGAPHAEISPTGYDFGPVLVGEQTAPINFDVCNTGEVPLEISNVALDNLDNFRIDSDNCTGKSLQAGAEDCCGVDVIFIPSTGETGDGRRFESYLQVTSNDPDSSTQAILFGYGIVVDSDGDGIFDCNDSCPYDSDNDMDEDGVCGNVDNCPDIQNPDQTDDNGNGIGDACESAQLACDLDQDGNIDIDDVRALLTYRNQPVSQELNQCDLDGDGTITVLDSRKLILTCTWPRCATSEP